jgi:peptidoglycan/xylan/chitin deacetylase (PgdA/CDA1 family)
MRHGQDKLVLCYHAVSSAWVADITLTPQALATQLKHLVDRGYTGVTFSQVALGEVSGRVVAVTFDDGYKSILSSARPIMERFGMPGTVFIPTDFIEGNRSSVSPSTPDYDEVNRHDLQPMSWADVRSLYEAGWEVGSHTKSHPHLTEVSDAQLRAELVDSRMTCEQMLEAECRSLAFPYGDHDPRVVAATHDAGYSAAATVQHTTSAPSPLRWPRIPILRQDGMRVFRLKTSRTVRRSPVLASATRALRLFSRQPEM